MAKLSATSFNVRPGLVERQVRVRTRREQRERIGSRALQQVSCENQLFRPEFSKDWAMVQRAIAGDAHCQTNLFAPYTGRLYRTAFSVLRNKEDAQDAVQDGLCKAFASLGSFQGRSTFSTWLTSIVKNAALMALRRKKSRPEASLDELLEAQSETLTHTTADAQPDPEQTCAAGEIRALVEEGLRELSPALQIALRLRITKANSTAELARALGISAPAFKSRISRARRQVACELRQSLATVASAYGSQSCREAQAKLGTREALRKHFAASNGLLTVSASPRFETDLPTATLRTMEPLAPVRPACSLAIAMTTEATDGICEAHSRSKTVLQERGFANDY
jgi:RNA polymerase sigma-70 factor (ECF subfamily)